MKLYEINAWKARYPEAHLIERLITTHMKMVRCAKSNLTTFTHKHIKYLQSNSTTTMSYFSMICNFVTVIINSQLGSREYSDGENQCQRSPHQAAQKAQSTQSRYYLNSCLTLPVGYSSNRRTETAEFKLLHNCLWYSNSLLCVEFKM